jgi:15-cis-phytoene synthase
MGMTTGTASWESRLLDWAYQGLQHHIQRECPPMDAAPLARAYAHCAALTEQHSRTFHLASRFLPPAKRRAMRALYAFCRVSDDLVDHPGPDPHADLAAWRQEALAGFPRADQPVALAWATVQASFGIPALYAHQLLDTLEQDLACARYQTFADLTAYCYGVASTVGLMAMHIVGFAGPAALPYAVKLGVALQLTNILRDVAEDWQAGRLYLPLDELAAFGVGEEEIAHGVVSAAWRNFMAFQIARVRQLYRESLPGVGLLHPSGRLAIGAAAVLYQGILDDIERHGMDVFSRRAHLSTWGKLRRLPGLWWRANVVGFGPRPLA